MIHIQRIHYELFHRTNSQQRDCVVRMRYMVPTFAVLLSQYKMYGSSQTRNVGLGAM